MDNQSEQHFPWLVSCRSCSWKRWNFPFICLDRVKCKKPVSGI